MIFIVLAIMYITTNELIDFLPRILSEIFFRYLFDPWQYPDLDRRKCNLFTSIRPCLITDLDQYNYKDQVKYKDQSKYKEYEQMKHPELDREPRSIALLIRELCSNSKNRNCDLKLKDQTAKSRTGLTDIIKKIMPRDLIDIILSYQYSTNFFVNDDWSRLNYIFDSDKLMIMFSKPIRMRDYIGAHMLYSRLTMDNGMSSINFEFDLDYSGESNILFKNIPIEKDFHYGDDINKIINANRIMDTNRTSQPINNAANKLRYLRPNSLVIYISLDNLHHFILFHYFCSHIHSYVDCVENRLKFYVPHVYAKINNGSEVINDESELMNLLNYNLSELKEVRLCISVGDCFVSAVSPPSGRSKLLISIDGLRMYPDVDSYRMIRLNYYARFV